MPDTIQIGTKHEQDYLPDAATANDLFVYTGDPTNPRSMWLCLTTYAATVSTLTIPAASRPGSVALVFSAVTAGSAGDFIDVVIADGGASGVASLAITGSGTQLDHYVYTFTMYDDDASNDSIIALLSGDLILTASGADATNASVVAVAQDSLSGSTWDNWRAVNIRITYTAEIPDLASLSDTIHASIPKDVVRNLPERLASALMEMDEGGDKGLADRFELRYEKGLRRAKKHRNRGSVPTDVIPG